MAEEHVAPRYWEKRVLAAYLLMMGETWVSTASKVGRTQVTIANWKRHPSWEDARKEAVNRWLYDMHDVSCQAVYSQVKGGDGALGMKVLERLEVFPAQTITHQHTGKDGKPIEVLHTHVLATLLDTAIEDAYAHSNGHANAD